MSASIKYIPVYLGLFASQSLALVCNAFLDVEYKIFGTEIAIWMFLFGFTLSCGYRFQGDLAERGKQMMRRFLWFSLIATVLIIMPIWGFPRAGIYILALLMVAYNCVTTTHKHLNMSLLMTLIMVMFATSHFRADWTMLFYLLPYLMMVVFTLIAAQVHQKAAFVQQVGIQYKAYRGQMFAMMAATLFIFIVGVFLYIITPQFSAQNASWKWGVPSVVKSGNSDSGVKLDPYITGLIREPALRTGMPEWQKSAIKLIEYSLDAGVNAIYKVKSYVKGIVGKLKKVAIEFYKKYKVNLLYFLMMLIFLALIVALYKLAKELQLVTWARTRLDYFKLVVLNNQPINESAAIEYYEAMTRLFELKDIKRLSNKNVQEYLLELTIYRHLNQQTELITRLFEDSRYGNKSVNKAQFNELKSAYKQIYKNLA